MAQIDSAQTSQTSDVARTSSVTVRDAQGAEAGTVVLDEAIFGIQPNVPVLHQVVTAQLAAARSGTQSTKTRAEVSGGGKKPFKQKGTGRARQGSERAPHFTGGGVALGPKPRSYRQKTPKKMVQLALRSALSDRASEGRVVVVSSWPWSPPSTKGAVAALAALGVTGKILVVLARDEEDAYKSFRNLTDVQVLLAGELNAYDVLINDWIVFTSRTLPGRAGEPAWVDVAIGAPVATDDEPEVEATTEDATSEDVATEDAATEDVAPGDAVDEVAGGRTDTDEEAQ